MINAQVCDFLKSIPNEGKYIANMCVVEGYGQSSGGYLNASANKPLSYAPSQKEHFLNYYGSKRCLNKPPSYHYLRCPQLLLFVAEVAGVSQNRLEKAYEILKKHENDKGLRGTSEKNGNYIWKESVFKEFKEELQISRLVKIIREVNNWEEVRIRAKEL